MSKAILDGFINATIDSSRRRYDVLVRRYLGKNQPHLITLTKEDFEFTLVTNFLKALEATGKQTYKGDLEKLKNISAKVFSEYPDKFNKYSNIAPYKERYAVRKGNTIVIYLPKYTESVRRAFVTLASKYLKKSFVRFSKEQAKKFSSLTQFLHTSTSDLNSQTVGTEQVRLLGNVAGGEKIGTGLGETNSVKGLKNFVTDEELESAVAESLSDSMENIQFSTPEAIKAGRSAILKMVDSIDWVWSKTEKNTPNLYNGNIVVQGKLGPSKANKPGEESLDWRNLRPQIEELIFKEISKKGTDFATIKGSQSSVDKVSAGAQQAIVTNLLKASSKNFKVTAQGFDKQESPKSRRGKRDGANDSVITGRSTTKKTNVRKKNKTSSATKKGSRNPQSLLSLQTILNSKLPQEVRKNMGYPGLVNRSGRFASSVRVETITRTRQGFPSIGYTYDKNPYQVFELGAGRKPWANKDRDPRKLIERSIRSIAADLLKARFYTRRL
jgi:hypothetical protein